MKWSLSQLFKYQKQPFTFEEDYDFHDRITSLDDVIDLSPVHVIGTGRNIINDRFIFNLHIEATFTLACARTLEPVIYPITLDVEEIFDTIDDDDINIIEKNTIDLENVIWENVYLEKPMRIFKDGTEEVNSIDTNIQSFYDNDSNKIKNNKKKSNK